MLDGTDSMSLRILEYISSGENLKTISEKMDVSYDQVKKLSRFFNLQQKLKGMVSVEAQRKFSELGIKSLSLVSFFTHKEWDGLEEALGSIPKGIRRSDLQKLYAAYVEKQRETLQLQKNAQYRIEELARKELHIQKEIENLKASQDAIGKIIKEFKKYSPEEQDFLLEHVGIASVPEMEKDPSGWNSPRYENGEIVTRSTKVLIKRLDYNWQQKLKKLGVVRYDDDNYVWIIPDVDRLVDEYRSRIKNRGRIEYDLVNTPKNSYYDYPEDPYYYSKTIESLNEPLRTKIKKQKELLKQLEEEKVQIDHEIHQLRKVDVKTFINRVEVTHALSDRELREHGRLQQLALKHLYEKGYVAAAEVSYKNHRFDAIGYNDNNQISIIEVKASTEDFTRDNKWGNYMAYCNELYFLFSKQTYAIHQKSILRVLKDSGAGILIGHKNRLELIEECIQGNTPSDYEKICFSLNRSISKKIIYGY